MADGTPAFFSSLNGSMYNPGSHNNVSWTNMWVTTRDEEWSHEQIVYINQSFENNYPEFIILDDATVTYNGQMGERSGSNVLGTSVNDAMGFSVNVSPNPASTWTTVEYTLPSPTSKATLILISALGVQVRSMKFEGTQGQKVIDLSNLADGVYMYMVKHGEYTQTGKLVVTK